MLCFPVSLEHVQECCLTKRCQIWDKQHIIWPTSWDTLSINALQVQYIKAEQTLSAGSSETPLRLSLYTFKSWMHLDLISGLPKSDCWSSKGSSDHLRYTKNFFLDNFCTNTDWTKPQQWHEERSASLPWNRTTGSCHSQHVCPNPS